MPHYRVLVQYDPEKNVYTARAPELEHCSAEGATRAEAIAKVEEEMDAQLGNMKESGGQPPPAVDDPGTEWSGEIAARVSKVLHRELAFQARAEGIELGQLLSELLPVALEVRRRERRRIAPSPGDREGDRPDRDRDRGDRRGGRGQGGRYHAIMEDKATFLEYVRGLDSGGGPRQPRDDRRGGRQRGRGGGGRGEGQGSGSGSEPDGNA